MPNLNDLKNFLQRDDVKEGEILIFTDAGEIKEVDFSKAQDGSGKKKVFQISIGLPDGRTKTATINATSRNALTEKYGSNTEDWVNKNVKVTFVNQMAFGKMTKVLVLVPVE